MAGRKCAGYLAKMTGMTDEGLLIVMPVQTLICASDDRSVYVAQIESSERAFDVFTLNLDFQTVTSVEIPGLRSSPVNAVVYVKRFGTGSYIEMADLFLDRVLDGCFAREVRKFVMRPYRITLPTETATILSPSASIPRSGASGFETAPRP